MRSIQINTRAEQVEKITGLVFVNGIVGVDVVRSERIESDGTRQERAAITFETSTPKAKHFLDALFAAKWFDREQIFVSSRERRAIVSGGCLRELTDPWVIPAIDILEDLYQFGHVTAGFVGRMFLGGAMLAYGLLNENLLMMIAGMIFLPLLPIMLGIGFGSWVRHWGMVMRSVTALVLALLLLFASGVVVGALGHAPVLYTNFTNIYTSLLISAVVGVAAALANTDDVGRRELIGLAATSQVAIIPTWLGLCLVLGLPATETSAIIGQRLLTLGANVACVIVTSLATFVLIGAVDSSLVRVREVGR